MLQLKKLRDALSEEERQKLLEKHQDPMRKAYNLMLEIKRQQEEGADSVLLLDSTVNSIPAFRKPNS